MIKWKWIERIAIAASIYLLVAGEGAATLIATNTALLCRLLSYKEDSPNNSITGAR